MKPCIKKNEQYGEVYFPLAEIKCRLQRQAMKLSELTRWMSIPKVISPLLDGEQMTDILSTNIK